MTRNKFLTLLACILAITILISSHGHTTGINNTQYNDQEVTEILKHLGLNATKTVSLIILSELIGDVIHEFGHYFTLKAIDPSMQNSIHFRISPKTIKKIKAQTSLAYHKKLFMNDPKKLDLLTTLEKNQILSQNPNPLFTLGKTSFYGNGNININSTIQKEIDTLSPTQKIMFYTAGGISKLVFSYVILTLLAAQKKYQETENFKDALVFGLQHALTPFRNISSTKKLTPIQLIFETILATVLIFYLLDHLFYTFTPVSIASFSDLGGAKPDGVHVWNTLLGYNKYCDLNDTQAFTFNCIKFLFWALYVAALVLLAKKSITTFLQYYKKEGQEEQSSPELGEIEAGGIEREEIEMAIREALQKVAA